MKKCVNGQIIDMTPDEVTAYQEETITTQQQIPTAGLEDKMRVYIESIPTANTPTVPPKVGFKWELIYSGSAGFAWELVPDPDAAGTASKPFEWFAGIRVVMGSTTTRTAWTLRSLLLMESLQPLKMKGF